MRSLLLLKAAELTERDEPPSIDEVAHLALALHRIEGANRHRLARDQATAETAAPPAPREHPSTEEMRALLGPAIKEAFHPERLGSKPWEPWPDAPSPAEPVAGESEPPWDPSAGNSAWDKPVSQGEEEARKARDESALRDRAKRRTGTARLSGTIWATRPKRMMTSTRAKRTMTSTRAKRAMTSTVSVTQTPSRNLG